MSNIPTDGTLTTRATYRAISEIPKKVWIRQIYVQIECSNCGVRQAMSQFVVPLLSDDFSYVPTCPECGRSVNVQHVTVIGITIDRDNIGISLPMMTDYVYLPNNSVKKEKKKIKSRWELI